MISRAEYAHHLPIHKGGEGPDGRTGWHVLNSAIAYLTYRRGDAWRPATHRFHPDVRYCTAGIALLLFIRARVERGWTAEEIAQSLIEAGFAHGPASGARVDLPVRHQPEREESSPFLAPAVCFCADLAERRLA